MITCDCCKEDVTPNEDSDMLYYEIVRLNCGKKCYCHDCWIVLGEWAGSKEHKKATLEYRKIFEKENGK